MKVTYQTILSWLRKSFISTWNEALPFCALDVLLWEPVLLRKGISQYFR